MGLNQKVDVPRYQKIAVEVATRIVSGEYKVGSKIYARSSLSSQFGVSAETARRAISVLSDLNIVTSEKGSGVKIESQEKASEFINQFQERKTIDSIKDNLNESAKRQKEEMEYFNKCLKELIEASEHFKSLNPFVPFELKITKECLHINKTVSELQLWQNTGATLLAIKRNNVLIKSPGPYISLKENDIIYFITQDDSRQKVKFFLFESE